MQSTGRDSDIHEGSEEGNRDVHEICMHVNYVNGRSDEGECIISIGIAVVCMNSRQAC